MDKIEFEWDDKKAKSNLEKHGVSFELASEIFYRSTVFTFEDDRFDYGEVREVAIGEIEGICLYIIFTVRGESLRIISARKASIRERRAYYDHIERTTNRNTQENE